MVDNRYNEHVVDEKKAKANGEVWTPPEVIDTMCDKIPDEQWKDPKANFLDPTMGSGNIIVRMIERRILNGVNALQAVKTTYGVELEQGNVNICRDRVLDILRNNGVKITKSVLNIVDNNFVCHDFFDWDFENWRPKTEEQKRQELLDNGQVDINDTPFAEFLG